MTAEEPSPNPPTTDAVTLTSGPLAPPVAEAVRRAATAYAEDPSTDVEEQLRQELTESRAALEDASVLALARAVRAGRSEEVVGGQPEPDAG